MGTGRSHPAPAVKSLQERRGSVTRRPEPAARRDNGAHTPSRRGILLGGGATVLSAWLAACSGSGVEPGPVPITPTPPTIPPLPSVAPNERATVTRWAATRTPPYYIAHRGAGGVVPEHTLPSYAQALAWGADCVEVSVQQTRDGHLICLHDETMERTTDRGGAVRKLPWSIVQTAKVLVPPLGPGWQGEGAPTVPLLADALDLIAHRAVICLEAKYNPAFVPMMAMAREKGLLDSVIAKMHWQSPHLRRARQMGLARFVYLGEEELTPTAVSDTLRELDRERDVIVLPVRVKGKPLADALARQAFDSGVPTWLYPVHRRSEVTHFHQLGVQGFITPDLGYLAAEGAARTEDDWASGKLDAGQLTYDPYDMRLAPGWSADGILTLDFPGRTSFVTLGQFCPVPNPQGYTVEIEAQYVSSPSDPAQAISLAFASSTDAYYEHRDGAGDGYHALLRSNGELGVWAQVPGKEDGVPLGAPLRTPALVAGEWTRLRLDVTADTIRWNREGHGSVSVNDRRTRGAYLHLGRTGADGAAAFRDLRLSPL